MEGRTIGRASLIGRSTETYTVREHGEEFQPPQFVNMRPDLYRENVFQNQQSIPFFLSPTSPFRVTFRYNGVWCYIPPYDNKGKTNPRCLLDDPNKIFEFAPDAELEQQTMASPFRNVAEI
jgi:hypothetical protein